MHFIIFFCSVLIELFEKSLSKHIDRLMLIDRSRMLKYKFKQFSELKRIKFLTLFLKSIVLNVKKNHRTT